jgi:hypothetical protein
VRTRLAASILALASACGCGRRIFYEWRDEPYVRPCYAAGEEEALRRLDSVFADERDIGSRALSVMAREARLSGEEAKARRLARVLMMQFERESNPSVRSTILAIGLRNAGAGDEEVHAFLRERLARRESPVSAAHALASLGARGAFEAIAGVYDSTADRAVRYELLGALWLAGDARAIPLYERALEEIEEVCSSWPEKIHSMKKEAYARTLRSRLETLRAACGKGRAGAPEPRGSRGARE